MAGIWGVVGASHSIAITHWDGDETLYPVAYVYDNEDTLLQTLPLVHRALGYYSVCWCPDTAGVYNIVVVTYDDEVHTIVNEETQREGRTYFINDIPTQIADMPANVADAVWDEILPGEHDIEHSAGLYTQVIRQTVLETQWDIHDNTDWGLAALEEKIMDNRTILSNEINENETKIDALSSLNVTHFLNVVNEVQANRTAINNHDAHLGSVETSLTAEINENEVKIDTVLTTLQGIQNNTRFMAVVPVKMRIPDTTSNNYQFFLAMYDTAGFPAAPDQVPRVRIVKSDGTELQAFTNMVQDGLKVGQYYFNYSVFPNSSEMILRIEFEIVENATTIYLSRVSETLIIDSDLASIENKLDVLDDKVDDTNTYLTGGNGLAIINSKLDSLDTDVNENESLLNQIKSKTDQIISNPATADDVDDLSTQISGIPTISDIQNRLDTQSEYIMGTDSRNLTDVYDNERGTDNALLANDPRLNFLDVAISSRSGYTVSDIWNHATRTLTDAAPLSNSEVAKIWDYLTSNITVDGSIGKYILDMLDTTVSSRSALTLAQLTNALAPLALEASVSTVLSSVVNENNQNQILIQDILSLLALIKPQTDKIVDDGATQTSIINEINQNQTLLAGLDLLGQAIKDKTDHLHPDLAYESSVQQIPTNPLRDNDSRLDWLYYLSNLDVPVSTRAEDFPSDYAKAVELDNVKDQIIAQVNINLSEINGIPTSSEIDSKLVRLDNILVDLNAIKGIGFDTLLHSLVKIKEGQSVGPGEVLTPQQIWEYASRELTSFPEAATPSDITLAKEEIIGKLPKYQCWMSTTINNVADTQEVLCWLNKDGQTLIDTEDAQIVVSDGIEDIWSGTTLTPDERGVFKITKSNISSLINDSDKNYVISIKISFEGKTYHTAQPFYTVG